MKDKLKPIQLSELFSIPENQDSTGRVFGSYIYEVRQPTQEILELFVGLKDRYMSLAELPVKFELINDANENPVLSALEVVLPKTKQDPAPEGQFYKFRYEAPDENGYAKLKSIHRYGRNSQLKLEGVKVYPPDNSYDREFILSMISRTHGKTVEFFQEINIGDLYSIYANPKLLNQRLPESVKQNPLSPKPNHRYFR